MLGPLTLGTHKSLRPPLDYQMRRKTPSFSYGDIRRSPSSEGLSSPRSSGLACASGEAHPSTLKAARVLTGDKGYDRRSLVTELWETNRMKPVIDSRTLWKDGEIRHGLPGQANVTYDYKGSSHGMTQPRGSTGRWPTGASNKIGRRPKRCVRWTSRGASSKVLRSAPSSIRFG